MIIPYFKKKRDQQHKKKKKTEKNEKLNIEKAEEEMDVQINECEIGNSPVFQPKTLKNKKKI